MAPLLDKLRRRWGKHLHERLTSFQQFTESSWKSTTQSGEFREDGGNEGSGYPSAEDGPASANNRPVFSKDASTSSAQRQYSHTESWRTAVFEWSARTPLRNEVIAFGEDFPEENRLNETLDIWEKLILICSEPTLRHNFLPRLSVGQINSLRLLLLWKAGAIPIPQLLTSEDSSEFPRTEDIDLTFQALYVEEIVLALDTKPLDQRRKTAAKVFNFRRLLDAYLTACNIQAFTYHPVNKAYLALETDIRAEIQLSDLSSTIEPCWWLDRGVMKGKPYYLWDVELQQTVRTDSLEGKNASYAVVSHTWGRWRKTSSPGLNMEKHRVPWLVPENSLFPVQDLPDGLQILGRRLSVRYVWIDLLCIPQDPTSKLGKREISRQAAIFSHATTAVVWFNTTTSWDLIEDCIHWMLLNSQSINAPSEYRLQTLWKTYPLLKEKNAVLTSKLRSVNVPEFRRYRESRIEMPDEPIEKLLSHYWFSSLWTLQEAFLRPDMLLVNKEWEILTIGGKVPVALDTLFDLTEQLGDVMGPRDPPLQWLYDIFEDSRLLSNHHRHPVMILDTGCARYCEHSRSEAIMSAIGCVEWQRSALPYTAEPRSSISKSFRSPVDVYDYEFLTQVRHKYGDMFFFSMYGSRNEYFEAHKRRFPVGTILPFSIFPKQAKHESRRFLHILPNDRAHPSTRTWTILPNGSVKITEAAIIHSTPAECDQERVDNFEHFAGDDIRNISDITCFILGVSKYNRDATSVQQQSLREWMNIFCIDTQKFAVVHSSQHAQIRGFILKAIPIELGASATILAKIADFWMEYPEYNLDPALVQVPTTYVDWIVY
ncbi:hypothetical protein BDW68DRAFT_171019 [Aspergillus falconensis]